MMEVVIHAGIHRTGTTSLQTFLSRNRTGLMARGVGYPGEGVHHQRLVWSLKRGNSGAEDVIAAVEGAAGAATVVLSGEDFCILPDLAWLGILAARHSTRAVFYLRRQDHWVMSWYNQHVKWPFDQRKAQMGPKAFLETLDDFHWLDYDGLLERWEAVLGHDAVSVGVVEPGQIGDVVGDFVGRLGLACDGLEREAERSNDSLPIPVLEIARHLGLARMAPAQRLRLLDALRTGLADKTAEAKTVYSPEERWRILERFAASNRAVARRFFGRDELFLEPPPPPDAPYFRFPDLPRQKLMREWVAPVIRHLLKAGD